MSDKDSLSIGTDNSMTNPYLGPIGVDLAAHDSGTPITVFEENIRLRTEVEALRARTDKLEELRQQYARVDQALRQRVDAAESELDKTSRLLSDASILNMALEDKRSEVEALKARAEAADQRADNSVDSLKRLISSDTCERHEKHILGQSFNEFMAEQTSLGCAICNHEQLSAQQAVIGQLRDALGKMRSSIFGAMGCQSVDVLKFVLGKMSTAIDAALAKVEQKP
jgi:DNA repair exonuclease SbcCD ATPase subunit